MLAEKVETEREMHFTSVANFLHLLILGQDSCNGDSGGPLIGRFEIQDTMYLSGVVSFGTPTCGIGFPGVYTNVQEYLPWIKEQLKP